MKKYIVGWLRFRPGKRDEFIEIYREGAEAARKEPGCIFYDYGLSHNDPDTMLIMECFRSEEEHASHLQTAHFRKVWAAFETYGASGDFEDIWADTGKPSSVKF